jgi:hypothetical protein
MYAKALKMLKDVFDRPHLEVAIGTSQRYERSRSMVTIACTDTTRRAIPCLGTQC